MANTTGRQALRSQQARDQIVQAALAVFALKGYAAASMDDVCMAAGLSKGGLYHHFPTKGAVLGGVVDRLAALDALSPPFDLARANSSLSPDAIGRVLVDVWAEASRNPDMAAQIQNADSARPGRTSGADSESRLSDVLALGSLIQALTRSEADDASAAADRLGFSRAA